MKLRLMNEVDSRMRELERRASGGDYEAQEQLDRHKSRINNSAFQIMLTPGGQFELARMGSAYQIGAIPIIVDIGPQETWPEEGNKLYPYALIGRLSTRHATALNILGNQSSCPIDECTGARCALCNNLNFAEQMRTDMANDELHSKMQNPAYALRAQQSPITYVEVEELVKT